MLRQVCVHRPSESGGYYEDVWWIDNRFAIRGMLVEDEDGTVWTVAEVYSAAENQDVHRQGEVDREFKKTLERKTRR